MLCDVSMAQPRNVAVDAEHDCVFSFIFHGDGCNGADYFVYDRENPNYEDDAVPSSYLYDARRVYYNNELVDVHTRGGSLGGRFVNNKSYMWKVRLYESYNLNTGIYPSVLRDKGEVTKPPYFFGTTAACPAGQVSNISFLWIETGLDFDLPMWVRIGDDDTPRIILEYFPTTGLCRLKTALDTYPDVGTPYSMSSIRTYKPTEEIADNQLCVSPGITCLNNTIFKRDVTGQADVSPYVWFVEIDGEYIPITKYNYKLGLITLNGSFSTTPEAGTNYNLWCSYVDSAFFACTTKPTPYFTNTAAALDGENIHFTSSIATNSTVKYYYWDIYEDGVLKETTMKIYMGKLDYYYKGGHQGKTYKGVLHIMTQDGMVNQEDADWWNGGTATNVAEFTMPASTDILVSFAVAEADSQMNSIKLTLCGSEVCTGYLFEDTSVFTNEIFIGYHPEIENVSNNYRIVFPDGYSYLIKSYNSDTGLAKISPVMAKHYAEGTSYSVYQKLDEQTGVTYRIFRHGEGCEYLGDFTSTVIYDYKCASRMEYSYTVIPFTLTTLNGVKTAKFYKEVESGKATPSFGELGIYGLIPLPYEKFSNDDTRIDYSYQKDDTVYKISEFWGASINLDNGTGITQNLNRTVNIGTEEKPVGVIGSSNYDTFSLTFTLGRLVCGEGIIIGTIDDIRGWKRFIANSGLVMLKSVDGEVWFGKFTSNSYTKSFNGRKPEYSVTAEFTELKNSSTVRIAN